MMRAFFHFYYVQFFHKHRRAPAAIVHSRESKFRVPRKYTAVAIEPIVAVMRFEQELHIA
jgi:hypothetical protein